MSRNKWEWLVVLAIGAAFVGYCNYQDRQRQQPAAFEQRLIGTWASEEVDPGTPPIRTQLTATFDPNHVYQIVVLPGDGSEPMRFTGSWQLRDDPRIVARVSTRFLVLSGQNGVAGEHLTTFDGHRLHCELLKRTGTEWRIWTRVQ